jgi:hypothetical protein
MRMGRRGSSGIVRTASGGDFGTTINTGAGGKAGATGGGDIGIGRSVIIGRTGIDRSERSVIIGSDRSGRSVIIGRTGIGMLGNIGIYPQLRSPTGSIGIHREGPAFKPNE